MSDEPSRTFVDLVPCAICKQLRTVPIQCRGERTPENAGRYYSVCLNNTDDDRFVDCCKGFFWMPSTYEPTVYRKPCRGGFCNGKGTPNQGCFLVMCSTCCSRAAEKFEFLRACRMGGHKPSPSRNLIFAAPPIPTPPCLPPAAPAASQPANSRILPSNPLDPYKPTPIGAYLSNTYIQHVAASDALRAARALQAERQKAAQKNQLDLTITWWFEDGESPKFYKAATDGRIFFPHDCQDLCSVYLVDKERYQFFHPVDQLWMDWSKTSPAIVLNGITVLNFASTGVSAGDGMPRNVPRTLLPPAAPASPEKRPHRDLELSTTLPAACARVPRTPSRSSRSSCAPGPATPSASPKKRTVSLSPTKRSRIEKSYVEMAEHLEKALFAISEKNATNEEAFWVAFPDFETYSRSTFYKYLRAYERADQGVKDACEEVDATWQGFMNLGLIHSVDQPRQPIKRAGVKADLVAWIIEEKVDVDLNALSTPGAVILPGTVLCSLQNAYTANKKFRELVNKLSIAAKSNSNSNSNGKDGDVSNRGNDGNDEGDPSSGDGEGEGRDSGEGEGNSGEGNSGEGNSGEGDVGGGEGDVGGGEGDVGDGEGDVGDGEGDDGNGDNDNDNDTDNNSDNSGDGDQSELQAGPDGNHSDDDKEENGHEVNKHARHEGGDKPELERADKAKEAVAVSNEDLHGLLLMLLQKEEGIWLPKGTSEFCLGIQVIVNSTLAVHSHLLPTQAFRVSDQNVIYVNCGVLLNTVSKLLPDVARPYAVFLGRYMQHHQNAMRPADEFIPNRVTSFGADFSDVYGIVGVVGPPEVTLKDFNSATVWKSEERLWPRYRIKLHWATQQFDDGRIICPVPLFIFGKEFKDSTEKFKDAPIRNARAALIRPILPPPPQANAPVAPSSHDQKRAEEEELNIGEDDDNDVDVDEDGESVSPPSSPLHRGRRGKGAAQRPRGMSRDMKADLMQDLLQKRYDDNEITQEIVKSLERSSTWGVPRVVAIVDLVHEMLSISAEDLAQHGIRGARTMQKKVVYRYLSVSESWVSDCEKTYRLQALFRPGGMYASRKMQRIMREGMKEKEELGISGWRKYLEKTRTKAKENAKEQQPKEKEQQKKKGGSSSRAGVSGSGTQNASKASAGNNGRQRHDRHKDSSNLGGSAVAGSSRKRKSNSDSAAGPSKRTRVEDKDKEA
ncbi:hypothetical protein AURDEDRAFT_148087 [Auricularia subglabra TFB-10046 SS5]|nr:hypothetical protein AURDEDRAFT_148087 [Auricularia subglabra TFB-10046 SS5]